MGVSSNGSSPHSVHGGLGLATEKSKQAVRIAPYGILHRYPCGCSDDLRAQLSPIVPWIALNGSRCGSTLV